MAQFMVLAYDGGDAGAKERRMAARPAHFAGLEPMVARGEILTGGALLDDGGNMIGSILLTEFPSRAELDAWLEREPYVTGGVWHKIEVKPARVTIQGGKVNP
jgi:uncharacterized protein YciI